MTPYMQMWMRSAAGRESLRKSRERYRATEKGRVAMRKANAQHRIDNPDKAIARHAIQNAIRDGKIMRPTTCSVCGCVRKVESHHPDYTKPFEVVWVCRPCHRDIHRGEKE